MCKCSKRTYLKAIIELLIAMLFDYYDEIQDDYVKCIMYYVKFVT